MIELELFFKTVEAKTRKNHTSVLKVFARLLRKKQIPKKDKYLQGYNKGIEEALDILKAEFKAFDKRMRKAEREGCTF